MYTKQSKSQQNNTTNLKDYKDYNKYNNLNNFKRLSSGFLYNPHKFLFNQTTSFYKALEIIVNADAFFKGNIEVSQAYIAKKMGTTLRTAHYYTNLLTDGGFIAKEFRWYRSSLYSVNPILKQDNFIKILMGFVPSFSYFLGSCFSLSILASDSRKKMEDRKIHTNRELVISLETACRVKDMLSKNKHCMQEARAKLTPPPLAIEKKAGENKKIPDKKEYTLKKRSVVMDGLFDFEFCGHRLTTAGMIELLCFDKAAIEYARKELKNKKAAKEPFGLLFYLCKKYSADNRLAIDYAKIGAAKRAANVEEGAAKVERVAIEQKEIPKREEWTQYGANEPLVEINYTAEEVEANVKQLEQSPYFTPLAGCSPKEMFKSELESGETVVRSEQQLARQEKAKAKLENDMAGYYKRKLAEGDKRLYDLLPEHLKYKPESTKTNEKGSGNVTGPEERRSFNQIDSRGIPKDGGRLSAGELSSIAALLSKALDTIHAQGGTGSTSQTTVLQASEDIRQSEEPKISTYNGSSEPIRDVPRTMHTTTNSDNAYDATGRVEQAPAFECNVLDEHTTDGGSKKEEFLYGLPF